MVKQCCICKKIDIVVQDLNLTFHRFPRDVTLKQAWCEKLGLQNVEKISKYALICSTHFNENDFVIKPAGRRMLRPGAFPLSQTIEKQFLNSEFGRSKNDYDPLECIAEPPRNKCLGIFQGTDIPVVDIHGQNAGPSKEEVDSKENIFQMEPLSIPTFDLFETKIIEPLIKIEKVDEDSDVNPEMSDCKGNLLPLLVTSKRRKRRLIVGVANTNFATSKKARENIKRMKKTIISQRKSIRKLKQTVKNLQSRVSTLTSLFGYLKENLDVRELQEAAK